MTNLVLLIHVRTISFDLSKKGIPFVIISLSFLWQKFFLCFFDTPFCFIQIFVLVFFPFGQQIGAILCVRRSLVGIRWCHQKHREVAQNSSSPFQFSLEFGQIFQEWWEKLEKHLAFSQDNCWKSLRTIGLFSQKWQLILWATGVSTYPPKLQFEIA